MYAIEVHNVQKSYKNGVQALNGLNLTVKTGEIFSLLGQNGAGKSTLISILTTYLKPNTGKITMLGKDILKDSGEIRSYIACVAQRTSIDTHLSLEENMMFQARLYKIPKNEARKRMSTLIDEFELGQYLKYPVSSYSGGIKRRLDIALNMMSNPKILFLDEPTVGMDIQSRMTMWKMMRKIRDDFGTTIFLTTHYLEEADNLSDTICIMKDGKEIVQGSPFELRTYTRQDAIKVQFSNKENAKIAIPLLSKDFTQLTCTLQNDSILMDTTSSESDLIKVNKFLLKSQISFQGIEIAEPTLEDVFLRLTEKKED
ncbi:ABC transporter ATP-binding protein [Anaerosphaera multitolerans]|uniref:ABC transporter ATP-binding protein n=1 Tax=Anaerosphaera multitolerans TaxID=2487351 RepID=A0A437S8M7_9FIRM|nr:ABC transporter ATP-binding protein [Anaerosphaera multitolerans]RVU55446.1 ABC transporter ATP-binding protein [Anaerosphaera multitolerans]